MMKHQNNSIRLAVTLLTTCLLNACLSTDEERAIDKNTETLGGFANSASSTLINTVSLTRQERTDKLAKTYRAMLNLEPNVEVRAQIQHRMVQLDVEQYEANDSYEQKDVLAKLVANYQQLLTLYPDRAENEKIHYELAKTLDLQGKSKESVLAIETLLTNYPNTQYYAELQFRRAELYYNLQHYPRALSAYQAVLKADRNENYRLNSLYMSGWSLFKLNRLEEADEQFLLVLSLISTEHNDAQAAQVNTASFSFNDVSSSYKSLAADTQRVLTISLSQQQQSTSLVSLLKRQSHDLNTKLFAHILFDNLALFLQENNLYHDALVTYQDYIVYAPNSIWAARFSLKLHQLYRQKNNFAELQNLEQQYVENYGLTSQFWPQLSQQEQLEILPNIKQFSLSKGRRLYAKAQDEEEILIRQNQFKLAAVWLKTYLDANRVSEQLTGTSINSSNNHSTSNNTAATHLAFTHLTAIQERYLFADASFEAQNYQEALITYRQLADQITLSVETSDTRVNNLSDNLTDQLTDQLPVEYIVRESAYAATYTAREMLKATLNAANEQAKKSSTGEHQTEVENAIIVRKQVDDFFIQYFAADQRAKLLAMQQAQFAFDNHHFIDANKYADFILIAYHADKAAVEANKKIPTLTPQQLAQVSLASQLKANASYQQKNYPQAESDYLLALNYIAKSSDTNNTNRLAIEELIASAIYAQAKAAMVVVNQAESSAAENSAVRVVTRADDSTEKPNTELALYHLLRLGKLVPHSKYRVNAEFDAANLLLAEKQWSQAVPLLLAFQQRFPNHQYSSTIPAKLALSYENLAMWPQAAEQLLLMVGAETNPEMQREAKYTAAEYYLKAGDKTTAFIQFRDYAHQYPEPFSVAQEVRFKLSEFYRETNEPNKRYFWFRKIISAHKQKLADHKSNLTELARSTYLSSYSAFHLGQAHQQTFNHTKLKIPLNKSLKSKQSSMKEAINYYQLVFDWQLVEFVPQANYAIAEMYRKLAIDVMASEKPRDLDDLALEEYDLLLEEIAYPFEEKSIAIHQENAKRAWQNIYDQSVKNSFKVLAEIEPAKYQKFETVPEVIDEIF